MSCKPCVNLPLCPLQVHLGLRLFGTTEVWFALPCYLLRTSFNIHHLLERFCINLRPLLVSHSNNLLLTSSLILRKIVTKSLHLNTTKLGCLQDLWQMNFPVIEFFFSNYCPSLVLNLPGCFSIYILSILLW